MPMPFDELIETLKLQYEIETGWGDSRGWTNQDFINLSERIHQRTGVTLSHVTLKRIWGKVKYDSLPNTYTLDTLANFIGFNGWRGFVTAHQKNGSTSVAILEDVIVNPQPGHVPAPTPAITDRPTNRRIWQITTGVALVTGIVITYLSINKNPPPIADSDYTFSSKKAVTQGLPNSVVFNYDASKAPGDSVIIQQSWDKKLRQKVSKLDKQHTSIYYYPDYYRAKLIVNNKIVKQHDLLIKSNGWLGVVTLSPVPVYFDSVDVMKDGKMSLNAAQIQARNIKMQPVAPFVLFSNVKDFGEIYSDDFVFETSLKNNYKEGAAICQQTHLYLLCRGTAIGIPLCAKGCVSDVDFIFTNYFRSGKKKDLSMFGVDFSKYVKVRVEAHNRVGKVYLDDKLVYTVNSDIIRSKIIGIDFSFQGTGSVDYVKLSNGKVNYEDDF
ncbi:hypothetical protein IDJ77_00825 [Mucilaginibacter sp. ZT4R22]|uniref:Uncharacterized protein n=1 Tax=Mucilaginibacter pankratovii TaxID=2772110 RepID=A0ABR7WJ29_9SPHI|nr:hypothetical protein [Mucilaginibacter pankratovii]MBD1362337.1 hypothetical protein [Mucilaginibacter pankratovii]